MAADLPEPGFPQGLSWSWQMDFPALLAALSDVNPADIAGPPASAPDGDAADPVGPDPSAPDGGGPCPSGPGGSTPDPSTADTLDAGGADAAAEDTGPASEEAVLAALDQGAAPLPAGVIAARVAEQLAPGPDLVAWLETAAPPAELSGYDQAGAALAWRRVAAYAQARELAHVAQLASSAAQRDTKIGTDADGRPACVPAAAAAEVSLALIMTRYSAEAWTDLAVDLRWRLRATGTALAAGLIDLPRARLIARHTGSLTDTAARAVEERVLPAAGQQTTGALYEALRRAVIAVDPNGAQQRKEDAERRAKVSLYPEHDDTATLTAQGLPTISAAAAMARITAMARAMKSAGSGGGLDFLRAQVLIGLLLGTLPLIPPAPGAPPDDDPAPPDDDPANGADDSSGDPSDGPDGSGGGPGDGSGGGPDNRPASPAGGPGSPKAGPGTSPGNGVDDGPWHEFPDPRDEDAPEDTGDDRNAAASQLTGTYRPDSRPYQGNGPPGNGPPRQEWCGPRDDEDWLETGPLPGWPGLPAAIPPGLAAPGASMSRPVAGLLDVTVPWHTLTGTSTEPGHLGRIGPVTASDTRRLADCAARDPATIWRIVVTSRAGLALAVIRLPRKRGTSGRPPSPGAGVGLVGRITLTIPEDTLDGQPPPSRGPGTAPEPDPSLGPDLPPVLQRAFQHAVKALASARVSAAADRDAGGCAHLMASTAYQVPPRLRDYITARDVTCRFTTCRQPVWHCDIDHTKPYNQGGRTCKCNNGGLCRTHHQIKQLPGWTLHQPTPGVFRWTTPSGRTYTTTPDPYPA